MCFAFETEPLLDGYNPKFEVNFRSVRQASRWAIANNMLQRRSSRRDHQGSHQGSQGDSGSGNTSLDSLHDDILAEVLTQLAIGSDAEVPFSDEWLRHFPTVCLVAHRFHRAAQLDAVWQPVCSRRWKLQTDEEKWLAAAVRAAAQAAAQQPSEPQPTWKAQYRLREDGDILKEYPVFFMGGSPVVHGHPFGIHFFEPRYRRLVAHAMNTDRKFVYAVKRPRANLRAMLCECHRVLIYPDGRANLYVLPVATVAVKSASVEQFDPDCPPLHWAQVEEIPERDDTRREQIQELVTFAREILSRAESEDDEEEQDDGEEEDDDEEDEDDDEDDDEEEEDDDDDEQEDEEENEEEEEEEEEEDIDEPPQNEAA